MARVDAIVLGLASSARRSRCIWPNAHGGGAGRQTRPGEETSYGNTGVIVGASVFPTAFPRSLKKLIQVALKRTPEANYHWGDLMRSRPGCGLLSFSTQEKLKDSAVKLRPLMAHSIAEHEALMAESDALNTCARPAG